MANISDELYARSPKLKIFVSSQMRSGVLAVERVEAAKAIDSTGFAASWYWERHANAGPYSAEDICLGHARTSDGLVLIISADLTPITQREYNAAKESGAPCYIFLKDGVTRNAHTARFVEGEQAHAVTANFRNSSELRTRVTGSLREFSNRAVREKIAASRRGQSSVHQLQRLKEVLTGLITKTGRAR